MDAVDAQVIEAIRGLAGVLRVVPLDPEDRRALEERRTPEAAENVGVAEVLSRPRIVCLFKDHSFRPPPEPTVLLTDDAGQVLGHEILPGEQAPANRRVVYLGKDFVLFRGERPHGRYRFLLPAVRFPEVEALPGVERVVSASPDSPQDDFLRARYRIPPGNEYASVLVGYAVPNP